MLTLTPQASDAIRGILATTAAPEGAILRISSNRDAGLEIALVDGPGPDDQIVERDGAEVAVDPTAAVLLDDKQLDAAGEGEDVSFSISDPN